MEPQCNRCSHYLSQHQGVTGACRDCECDGFVEDQPNDD
jgi:hypothetical protein